MHERCFKREVKKTTDQIVNNIHDELLSPIFLENSEEISTNNIKRINLHKTVVKIAKAEVTKISETDKKTVEDIVEKNKRRVDNVELTENNNVNVSAKIEERSGYEDSNEKEFNCETSAVKTSAEIESISGQSEYRRFVDQAWCMGTETTLSAPIDDGAVHSGCVVLKMEYGNYVVNGVGQTPGIARANAMAKTNGLLRQQLGFVQPRRDAVPVDKEDADDFLHDVEIVLNSDRFSRKHQSYLKLTRQFILEDYGCTDSAMTKLQKITSILGSLVSYDNILRNNTHIVKCMYSKYHSTGMGLSMKEAKSQAAMEMLHTLKQICGFVLIDHDVDSDYAGPAIGSMCLRLPKSSRFRLKVLKYFLITPHYNVSSEANLREIAGLTDETLQYNVRRSNTLLQVQYAVSYCRASATNVDESICYKLCCVNMILALHKWCGFNFTNKYEDVEKYYVNLNRKDIDD